MASRERTRPAPEPRGRGVGARRADGLRDGDEPGDPRRPPRRGGLLPRAPPDDLPRDQAPLRAQRADRRAHRLRAARTAGRARAGRRPRGRLQPRLDRAGGRQRPPLRADRPAELAPAPAAGRLADDPAVGPRPRGRAARARRAGREAALQRRPRGAGRGLPRAQGHPLARGRPARGAGERQGRGHRHAVGLRRPRQDHRRLSARQPDHPRRPPGDGQVRPRRQHRRARRGQAAAAGRLLLARDVGLRARPAADRQALADLQRQAAQGPGRRARVGEGAARLQRARGQRRCGSTSPRT